MVQLESAAKWYGAKVLFEDVQWLITPQDRVGLVGANGTGKSSLLKVLGGLETLDRGALHVARGVTLGYLPQDGLRLSGRTVFAECLSVFDRLRTLEREQEELARRLSELDPASAEYAAAAERFHQADTTFRGHGGYTIEAQVGAVLTGLGFAPEDWNRRTEEFSGGWQMRIALAKLLLEKPNLLLLDEPTNHLDLEARNWLESYLAAYPHAFVLVSHDRFFLDVTVRRIVELWNKKLHIYPGGYSDYERQKDERRAQLLAAHASQRERAEQLEAFINRFRYQASKARQVQSRIKELERMEKIEIPPEEKTIHFRFPQPRPSGRVVAEFRDVAKSYGTKRVLSGVNFLIERGDRIALVGANGAGKSTLIKMLAGIEPLTAGEYILGHNADPDYFAQDQYKELDPAARMIDDLGAVAPRASQTELRSLLGCFLFSEDDVFKQIGVLSGGERNRYALARMLMRPSNFLLLDEPTNHLDLRAKDVLLRALLDYQGTLVFVSHDRYFIDRLATRVFEVAAGGVAIYPGNYEEYLWKKEAEAQSAAAPPPPVLAPEVIETPAPATPPETRAKRLNPIKLRQMEVRCAEIEERVAEYEAEIAQLERELGTFQSAEHTRALTDTLAERRAALEALLREWEELSTELEANR